MQSAYSSESARRYLVTGAGSGIGRAIAAGLAESGATVIAVGRRRAPLADLAAQHPTVVPMPADVTDPATPSRLAAAVRSDPGRLDGLVNCAGLARFAALPDAGLDQLDAMYAVNLRAPVALTQALLTPLRRATGCVLNVSSIGGVLAMPGRALYGATKAALNSLTRSLAHELAPQIRVNALVPGAVDTPMYDDLGLDDPQTEELRAGLLSSTPMGRFGTPEEVARWADLILDPDRSGWMTGALLTVDGGRSS
ncbi:SDR family NAD(P)-dependent oxidoreductase [Microlunatus soli]|uniref:NAD(P)-dependent dehydrogenase, short-chain alcohol dehydrogenase family n=1 Tax=Microlunatus soli TaxID=630515 RepID=A0A1H1VUP5_9ACTN|nr:SDR family oxidoreductase [Microlunatus soli]SDS88708.1 NAD(P)-dependent dehydrogenase, short-chain alcohol dehydrogenase family [Microlunatus soli]